jgi:citrate synthase
MSDIPESANKGLENIIACTSEVSTIHDATLLFRGYAIEDLAENVTFEEIIYLLWYEKLPSQGELDAFRQKIAQAANLPEVALTHLESISSLKAHPMAKLRTAISFVGLLDPQADLNSKEAILDKALFLASKMGVIVSALSRLGEGKNAIAFQPGKSIAWNVLNMLRDKAPSAKEEKLFDTALILHADHELNASAFTSRVVISSNSDYYSAITAALGSLKGSLHGGANEQVMLMLKEIGSYQNIDSFIVDALSAKKKVMGIGHRVYKNGDPRAKILKKMSLEICEERGLADYHKMLRHIEEEMGEKKGLMPNVDFYSGLVYTALGLKVSDFTPIFAISRIAGWTAQIAEQMQHNRIYRPRAFYTGAIDLKVPKKA